MKNSKKTFAGITAFAFMLALASCSDNNENSGDSNADISNMSNSSGENTPVNAQEAMSHSFKAIEIDFDLPLTYFNCIKPIGNDGKIFISGYSQDDEETHMYITDTDFTNFAEINFEAEVPEGADCYYNTLVAPDETLYIIANITTYGDTEKPDWDDPDFDSENFDWDTYYDAQERSYVLYNIDLEGNEISQNEITGFDKYSDDGGQVYLNNPFMCGSQLLLGVSGSDYVTVKIGADGEIGDEIQLDEEDRYQMYTTVNDNDGNLYFSTWGDNGPVIKKIDAQTFEVSEFIAIDSSDVDYISSFWNADGDYCFYVSTSSSLFGLKEDGTTEEVINWLDSDLNGNYINNLLPLDNNEFIIYEQDWSSSSGSSKLYRLTQRDASELENVQIISMVVEWDDYSITSKVNEFNKSNDNYRIKIENYGKYYERDDETGKYLNSPANQLKMDIASGKTFDILAMGSSYSTVMHELCKNGAMADLYEYMGSNGTVSKDDILPNILEEGEYDGKLFRISPSFYVQSMAIKPKYFDKEGWTLQELMDTYNGVSDSMRLFRYSNTKSDILNGLVYTCGFIDFENAECHFDSPDFVNLLEFCNGLEETEEIDWETATDEEMNAYSNEQEVAIRNDKALVESVYLSSGRDYTREKYCTFDGDMCLVGMPNGDGNGAVLSTNISFAIMNNSANKEAAWKFISSMFEEEYQSGDELYQFPVLKSAFEEKLDECMENPYYIDSDGKKNEYDDTYWINGESIKVPNLTKQERDELEEYLLSAKPVISDYYYSGISNIILEEAESYFNGERSAQEAADIIQNRLSILVSEQY